MERITEMQDFFKEGVVSSRVQDKPPKAEGMGDWGEGMGYV